jgi:hypothetical protein
MNSAHSYDHALKHVLASDPSKRGGIQERICYTFFKAAMQADGVTQFMDIVQRSIEECEKADAKHRELGGDGEARREN